MARVAVVGHVEWADFVTVERVPRRGEILHAIHHWEEPGGGGAVAAVQLARLAGEVTFFTAVGDDDLGHRAVDELRRRGVGVEAVFRKQPTRRVFVYLDEGGERTITVIGRRMRPRAARVLTAAPRAIDVIIGAGVGLDAVVGSGHDPGERYRPADIRPHPAMVVRTEGTAGGRFSTADGKRGRWRAAPLPGPLVDTYGAGDTFAAALTLGLGTGLGREAALDLAARAAALCLSGRGPYGARLSPFKAPAPGSLASFPDPA